MTLLTIIFAIAIVAWGAYEEHITKWWVPDVVYVSVIVLLVGIYYLAPEDWEDTRAYTFSCAIATGLYWLLFSLSSRISKLLYSRKLASLPLREEFCTAAIFPCSLSFDKLYHLLQPYCTRDKENTFSGVYEPDDGRSDIQAYFLPDGNWILALLDDLAEEVLGDKELITIISRHQLSIPANLLELDVSTFAVCQAGKLHIYPASTVSICKRLGLLSPDEESSFHASDAPETRK